MNDEKRRMYDKDIRPKYRTNANQTKEDNPDSMYDWVKDVLATMMQELKDEANRIITIDQIVTIPLSYGLLGGQFHFTYFIYEYCPDCQGIHTCSVCNGAGRVPHLQDGVLITVECQECKGYGIRTKQWCGNCDHGLVKKHQEYILNIPIGAQTDEFIVIDNIGGYKKGYINKCYIKFVYKFEQQYQNFVMQDRQLYYYHTISIDELYQNVIQLINYNNEILTLPIKRPLMITSNGLRFIIPNAGYYNEPESKYDDLIVILEILIP